MRSSDAIRIAMAIDGVTYDALAQELGYRTPSGVYNAVSRRHGMRVDVLVKLADALGYEVILRRGRDEIKIDG